MYIVHKLAADGKFNSTGGVEIQQFETEYDAIKHATECVTKYGCKYIIFKAVSGVRQTTPPVELFVPF